MSRIGKKIIVIPEGVSLEITETEIKAKGPKGELSQDKPDGFDFIIENNELKITPTEDKLKDKETMALWGLYGALVSNMVVGVKDEFKKILELHGVGYRASVNGSTLELSLGFSHPVIVKAPEGITFLVEKNIITISGIDKQLVGQVAAEIRANRKPEPYKGKGVRYQGEYVIRKSGKKTATSV